MHKRIVALVGAATMATLVSGAGLAAASASPASPAASGTEHFYLMTTQPSASRYSVIATGLFTAGGTDVSGSKSDLVKLPGGSFKINHGGRLQGHQRVRQGPDQLAVHRPPLQGHMQSERDTCRSRADHHRKGPREALMRVLAAVPRPQPAT